MSILSHMDNQELSMDAFMPWLKWKLTLKNILNETKDDEFQYSSIADSIIRVLHLDPFQYVCIQKYLHIVLKTHL